MSEAISLNTRPLTVNEWFVTILVLALPLVNIVMYLYWATAEGVNLNKRNFCRASIMWFVVGVLLAIIAMIILQMMSLL